MYRTKKKYLPTKGADMLYMAMLQMRNILFYLAEPATTTPVPYETAYDVIIVMDSSVPNQYFDWMKNYVRGLANSYSIDNEQYRVGLLRYSTGQQVQWNLNEYGTKNEIIQAVDRVSYNPGERNTDQAIDYVTNQMFTQSNGDRDFARNYIVLLTGESESTDRYNAYKSAYNAEDEGIRLFTVGINLDDTAEIDEVSSHPLSTYQYLVNSEQGLLGILGEMEQSLNDSMYDTYLQQSLLCSTNCVTFRYVLL